MNDFITCPCCRTVLAPVLYNPEYLLNRDQWESQKPGDFFCRICPGNGRGYADYAYYWRREVTPTEKG